MPGSKFSDIQSPVRGRPGYGKLKHAIPVLLRCSVINTDLGVVNLGIQPDRVAMWYYNYSTIYIAILELSQHCENGAIARYLAAMNIRLDVALQRSVPFQPEKRGA